MRPLGLSRQELWSAGPDRLSGGNGRARRRCAWGSWGGPRRGRVQICCKGVPGREKRRMKARNINGSSREPRLDPGLCNRFGQTAPPRTPARTAAAAITPALGPGRPRPPPSSTPDRIHTPPRRPDPTRASGIPGSRETADTRRTGWCGSGRTADETEKVAPACLSPLIPRSPARRMAE